MKKSKKIILFVFISILISSCSAHKSIWPDNFKDDGNNYFLMAQIESIKNDTINFYTIEIYSTQPFFELKKFGEDSTKKISAVLSLLNREEYQTGILKDAKKNLMRKTPNNFTI